MLMGQSTNEIINGRIKLAEREVSEAGSGIALSPNATTTLSSVTPLLVQGATSPAESFPSG